MSPDILLTHNKLCGITFVIFIVSSRILLCYSLNLVFQFSSYIHAYIYIYIYIYMYIYVYIYIYIYIHVHIHIHIFVSCISNSGLKSIYGILIFIYAQGFLLFRQLSLSLTTPTIYRSFTGVIG